MTTSEVLILQRYKLGPKLRDTDSLKEYQGTDIEDKQPVLIRRYIMNSEDQQRHGLPPDLIQLVSVYKQPQLQSCFKKWFFALCCVQSRRDCYLVIFKEYENFKSLKCFQ